jgi:serine/threonine protein kinase
MAEHDPLPSIKTPWRATAARSQASEEAGPIITVPDHALLRRIGRGSYGEVWLAKTVLGGYRAVKIVHRHSFDDDRPFEREFAGMQRFEPVSRAHESQLNILHVGRGPGCFYYVMELADDMGRGAVIDENAYAPRTLRSELLFRGRLPANECVRFGLALTTALGHLHRHGLVHRDIKPSNIIFVNGIPKLADIGLVACAEATISFVGTEGYLPPEAPGTVQADIFSLGKVLYEISTGRDRQQFPELPTGITELPDRGALAELNQVFLRACDPNAKQRYKTAAEMQSDLALLQSGKSLARVQRLKTRLSILCAVAVLLVFASAVGIYVSRSGQNHRGTNVSMTPVPTEEVPLPQRTALQWPVSAGGNDHWYEAVPESEGLSWERASAVARAKGGYLVDILSAEENAFVFSLIDAPEYWSNSKSEGLSWSDGPWIGAYQQDHSNAHKADFIWSHDGKPLSFANWLEGQPDNGMGRWEEHHVKFFTLGSHDRSAFWNDSPEWIHSAYVIEYDFNPADRPKNGGGRK